LTVKYPLVLLKPFGGSAGFGFSAGETSLINLVDGLRAEAFTLTISNPKAAAKTAMLLATLRPTLSIIG
jgi:hypothetical protein